MTNTPIQKRQGPIIKLADSKGVVRRVFDFASLGFGTRLAEGMARSFAVKYGALTMATQSQAWRAVQDLSMAIFVPGSRPIQKIPKNALPKLRDFLARSMLGPKAAQTRLNVCFALIEWCSRNCPSIVDKQIHMLVPSMYRRTDAISRPSIPEELVKKVLAACYEDISEIEATLSLGRRLREIGIQSTDGPELRAIHTLLQLTNGRVPLQRELNKNMKKLVYEAGGLRKISEYLYPNVRQVFPFYLAILAQTGANPMALCLLRRDCVRQHPLVSNLERVVWDKPRSNREQYVDFPAGKQWSAPNLVRRLVALNDDLVSKAHSSERDFLFLASSNSLRPASVPVWASFHQHLDKFIADHDLTSFDLAGFRKHVAKAHHVQARTIIAAQERLNHVHESTTSRYTSLSDRAVDHDMVMIGFQGRLIREAQGVQPRWNKKVTQETSIPQDTLFGFRCSDPFDGLAPGSTPGKLCLQFHKCATCPGALIPLDDIRIVGKLLASSRHLEITGERAKKEGWWDRYQAVYEPIRQILSKELLSAVSKSVLVKAEKFAVMEILPYLE